LQRNALFFSRKGDSSIKVRKRIIGFSPTDVDLNFQEVAWISAPLLISANVFLHASIRQLEFSEILLVSGGIFGFFLVSGISAAVSLYLIQRYALGRKQSKFLIPYIVTKIIRMLALGTMSTAILLSQRLIKIYFYASVYGLFECVAGGIALEVITLLSFSGEKRRPSTDAMITAVGLNGILTRQ
uniref:Transmembrane protein n=1 Tax=Nippostrongylus brasiliensis TaxID=27835 RepID=A0A0N4XI26_NIPBR